MSSTIDHEELNWTEMDARLRQQILQQIRHRVNKTDQPDFVQDVIVFAWENLHRLDGQRSVQESREDQICAWVSGITRNRLLEYFRKRADEKRRYTSFDLQLLQQCVAQMPAVWDGLIGDEVQELLGQLLDEFHPKTLSVVSRRLDGKTGQQIADDLEWTVDRVFARLCRFRKKLQLLAEDHSKRNGGTVFQSSRSLADVFANALSEKMNTNSRMSDKPDGELARVINAHQQREPKTGALLDSVRIKIELAEEDQAGDREYLLNVLGEFSAELLRNCPSGERLAKRLTRVRQANPEVADLLGNLVSQETTYESKSR